jgi:hypothetical protein
LEEFVISDRPEAAGSDETIYKEYTETGSLGPGYFLDESGEKRSACLIGLLVSFSDLMDKLFKLVSVFTARLVLDA